MSVAAVAIALLLVAVWTWWRTVTYEAAPRADRAAAPTPCELCEEHEAIVTDGSTGFKVCSTCEEMLP